MGTINDIKSIFIGLSAYQQEQVLDGLLQEHEVQGKVIDLAIDELKQERNRKPCPFCQSNKVYKRGKQNGIQMYQCQVEYCKKWYSETTGTPLCDIKLKSKWQGYLRCMEQGMSLKAISEELKISIQTRFVECDEFELALSHKGQRNLEKEPIKRGTEITVALEGKLSDGTLLITDSLIPINLMQKRIQQLYIKPLQQKNMLI